MLFGWPAKEIAQAIDAVVQIGTAQQGVTVTERPGEWVALAELVAWHACFPRPNCRQSCLG